MRIFDARADAFISSTLSYEGFVYRIRYTLLFVIELEDTDPVKGD
jgi:hypothetical protein